MKITVNEVEVVKCQSVIGPLLLFVFAAEEHAVVFSVICTRGPAHREKMQAKT